MKTCKKLLAMLLALALAYGTVACSSGGREGTATDTGDPAAQGGTQDGGQDTAASDEPITLTLWACNSMIDVAEYRLPEEEWYISGAIARFEDLHPNVTIEMATYNDNAQVANDFKAATIAGYGPDITCFLNGPFLSSIAEGLLPMNDYVDETWRSSQVGWETVTEGLTEDGTLYGIPYGGQSVVCFAYNQSLVAQAGLDFEADPPRTPDEFYAALDAIRDAGILPFHVDESYPMLLLYGLGMWWEEKTGLDGILAHTNDLTPFTEDEGFLSMLEEYQKFYENGWVNEDAATSADQMNVFLQGGCALYPIGVWDLSTFSEAMGDDLGVLPMPTTREDMIDVNTAVGGVGAALCVSNFSENPDMAVEFVKFLTSRDELIRYYTQTPAVPIRPDITAEDIGMADNELFAKLVGMSEGVYFFPDNCLSLDAVNLYYTMPAQVLVGNMTPMELAEMMDEAQME